MACTLKNLTIELIHAKYCNVELGVLYHDGFEFCFMACLIVIAVIAGNVLIAFKHRAL